MRKLPPKDSSQTPATLALPTVNKTNTTHNRRIKLIKAQEYIHKPVYDNRYKQADIKKALCEHYKSKCAFCEAKVERTDVEHYRPKSIYYWLAYSWDNLLLACPTCNQDYKKAKFELQGTRTTFQASDLPEVHSLCEKYNQTEQPKLLHPEFDDFENIWAFDENGKISSQDVRGKYTIETCGLDRVWLNDERKRVVLNDFVRDLKSIMSYHPPEEFEPRLDMLLETFSKNAKDEMNAFLAFRNHALAHILPAILRELLT